ncbi:hypothetical protein BHE74_00025702 [Ensete ventricosum]|nr:hypothetical protein GW17_00011393 [Ensete ventricosum]RWW66898.1 hypothetical protein BHE74_00025702 [Ensete ventricosum]
MTSTSVISGDWHGSRCQCHLSGSRATSTIQDVSIILHDPGWLVRMSSSSSSASSLSPLVVESSSSSLEVEAVSSSSGGMSPVDIKAYRALEVMRSCHDFDSIVTEEPLALVLDRYRTEEACLEWWCITPSQMTPNSGMTEVWLNEAGFSPAPRGMIEYDLCLFLCFVEPGANLCLCYVVDMVNLKNLRGMPRVPVDRPAPLATQEVLVTGAL